MHLAAYHFDGDPDLLQADYERLIASLPDVLLNLSLVRSDGLTVLDACPTLADFESFTVSADFASARHRWPAGSSDRTPG